MEIQVRDEEGQALGPGQKGILWARGPQVMLGYFEDPQLTAKVIDSQGWFNTGDLGMLGWNMEVKILGDHGDICLSPTPIIDERLEDVDEPNRRS